MSQIWFNLFESFCHGQDGEWPTEDYIKNFNLGKVTRDTILLTTYM